MFLIFFSKLFFDDPNIIHVHGKIDPQTDKEIIESELILSDLQTVEKRLGKPDPDRNLVGESTLMKVGKRLIVGQVSIYSENDPKPVAHATCTYSVPPENFQS